LSFHPGATAATRQNLFFTPDAAAAPRNDCRFTRTRQRLAGKSAFITRARQRLPQTTVILPGRHGGRPVKPLFPKNRGGGRPKRLSFCPKTAAGMSETLHFLLVASVPYQLSTANYQLHKTMRPFQTPPPERRLAVGLNRSERVRLPVLRACQAGYKPALRPRGHRQPFEKPGRSKILKDPSFPLSTINY
jgi:hypothetical protein